VHFLARQLRLDRVRATASTPTGAMASITARSVVQGLVLHVGEIKGLAQYGIVDHVAQFSYGEAVGYGLLEHGFSALPRYGLTDGGVAHRPTERFAVGSPRVDLRVPRMRQ